MSSPVREPADLDVLLTALANPHRRQIVALLALHPSSISRLAEVRGLSLPAIHKHVRILEEAGLVARRKLGRTNILTLDRDALGSLQDWLGQFQTHWGHAAETLENYAAYLGAQPDDAAPREAAGTDTTEETP